MIVFLIDADNQSKFYAAPPSLVGGFDMEIKNIFIQDIYTISWMKIKQHLS